MKFTKFVYINSVTGVIDTIVEDYNSDIDLNNDVLTALTYEINGEEVSVKSHYSSCKFAGSYESNNDINNRCGGVRSFLMYHVYDYYKGLSKDYIIPILSVIYKRGSYDVDTVMTLEEYYYDVNSDWSEGKYLMQITRPVFDRELNRYVIKIILGDKYE